MFYSRLSGLSTQYWTVLIKPDLFLSINQFSIFLSLRISPTSCSFIPQQRPHTKTELIPCMLINPHTVTPWIPKSDSPLRWRSSCSRCCKALGPLAPPCLWVWRQSSSDPASPPSCSRCLALSSGGSRPRSLRKKKKTLVKTSLEELVLHFKTTSDLFTL